MERVEHELQDFALPRPLQSCITLYDHIPCTELTLHVYIQASLPLAKVQLSDQADRPP